MQVIDTTSEIKNTINGYKSRLNTGKKKEEQSSGEQISENYPD